MARILEGIFVLGCSLVGFSLNALEGSRLPISPVACIELLIMKHVL
jgi:hypothetical protein